MTDDEKFRFDAHMQVANFTREQRKARQDYEWKFTIAFWTLIVLAIQFLREHPLPGDGWCLRLFIALIIALLYGMTFLSGVHSAHRRDRKIGKTALSKANELLGVTPNCQCDKCGVLVDRWGQIFQGGTTLLLLIAFVALFATANGR